MADQPTEADILAAMKASGYMLEQDVATALEGHGFHVQTNRAFQDQQEGASREIDVSAIVRDYQDESNKLSIYAELICECKNSKSPFVFLLRPTTPADRNRAMEDVVLPVSKYHVPIPERPNSVREIPGVDKLGIRQLHYRFAPELKAVQFAKIVRDKATWTANHAGLYDALFYPLVKALLARRKEVREFNEGEWGHVWLFFPVVITTGCLFVIDTSSADPQPSPATHVTFTRHIKARDIDGHFSLDFVTLGGLSSFVTDKVQPFVQQVVDLAKRNPLSFKKSFG